jgi:uncharacterized protein DUF2026
MNCQLIDIEEYKRIFETIYSVLKFAGIKPEKSCTYFSLIGAILLYEHFGILCRSYSGAAAYYLNKNTKSVFAFIEKIWENNLIGTVYGFHSWNQSDEFVIDFQAPLFPEMSKGINVCNRKMFQKKIVDKSKSLNNFKNEGDFFYLPNLLLTAQLTDAFTKNPINMKIANICNEWFINPISKMEMSWEVPNKLSQKWEIKLIKFDLNGKW